MPDYTLTGTGEQVLDEPGSLEIVLTESPDWVGFGAANPPDYYGLGLIRLGTDHGYLPAIPINADAQLVPCPNGTTIMGYALPPGVEIEVTERPEQPYAGPTGPPGEDGADGSTGPISYQQATLGSNISTSANTQTTALSLSLAAGTWHILGQITLYESISHMLTGRITDLTTHYASGSASSVAGTDGTVSLSCIVVLASTTTIYLQGATQGAGTIRATLAANASGATATKMQAFRIA